MVDFVMNYDDNLPLRDVVFFALREAILKGELKPGERLMESVLAAKLGVSRTPIREAMRKLEQEGLVTMTHRRGVEVASITLRDLKDVLEVRRYLEELAVELACKKATEKELVKLRELQEEFKQAIAGGDLKDMAETDEAFHDVIYQATGNQRLIQILNNLREQMYRYRMECIKDEDKRTTLVEEHQILIAAVCDRDVDRAKKAIHVHIDNQRQTIIENLTLNEEV